MRIGIYGGTFNPPHRGHMAAAENAIGALSLDRLLLIPTRIAPHKTIPQDSPTPEQRLQMLRLGAKGLEKTEVSEMELRREGPSYTWDTLCQLRDLYPGAELVLVVGTDMFQTIDQWKNAEKILKTVEIAVLYRGEKGETEAVSQKKAELEARGARISLVNNPTVAISSTQVRRLVAFRCAGEFLPQEVEAYIEEHGLYGAGENLRKLSAFALQKKVTQLLAEKRVPHVLGCRDTAVELAHKYGADPILAERAALLHDVTKALDGPLQLLLCRKLGVVLDPFAQENPKILHPITGAAVAEQFFGEVSEVVSAIRWHTTGRRGMTTLEKIIYIADYIEPVTRHFPGVEELRAAAYEDLDQGVALGLAMTVDQLRQKNQNISSDSLEALEELQKGLADGKGKILC